MKDEDAAPNLFLHPSAFFLFLDPMLAIIGAQSDGFLLQIVRGADEANRLALRPHQNGMRNRRARPFGFNAAQKRAVADAGRAKNDVLAVGEIIRRKDAF